MRVRTGNVDFFLVGGMFMGALGVFLLLWYGPADSAAAGTFIMIGVIWVLVALGVRGFYRRMRERAEAERKLFTSGVRTVAVVDAVRTTGTVLNKVNQQIDLRLRVRPPGEPEFQYERRLFVPYHGLPRPGDLIEVAYDPSDRTQVALATDWSSETGGGRLLQLQRAGAAGAQPVTAAHDRMLERLERLERLRQSGTLTHAEFEAQKARILAGQEP